MPKHDMAKPEQQELDIFQLLEEVERRKAPAIEALLAQRQEIDDKLARLGYQTQKSAPSAPKAAKVGKPATAKVSASVGPSGNYDENKTCPICKIVSHDGRAHRSQDPKVAFTQQELSDRGLLPPA